MKADQFLEQLASEFPVPGDVAAEVDPPFVLAANVYRLRRERGLSQAGLAGSVGVSQPRIAEIERGDANPRLGTLAKLACALGVSVSALLDPECAETRSSEAPAVASRLDRNRAAESAGEAASPHPPRKGKNWPGRGQSLPA